MMSIAAEEKNIQAADLVKLYRVWLVLQDPFTRDTVPVRIKLGNISVKPSKIREFDIFSLKRNN